MRYFNNARHGNDSGSYVYSGGPSPRLMGAGALRSNDVFDEQGEELGKIREIMFDLLSGKISYAVLSYGGVFGFGEKLFAVPWDALRLDTCKKRFVLDIRKQQLASASGFDKQQWPDLAYRSWAGALHTHHSAAVGNEPHS